jgi:SAM-dependent methyltransferase
MGCSCCAFGNTADHHFDAKKVAKELAQYRRKGPGPTTRGLRDGLLSAGLRQGTLLDIGGGLGILSLELLDAEFSRAVVVDASSASLAAASEEAIRRGRSGTTEFVHGDFLAVAETLEPSSAITRSRRVLLPVIRTAPQAGPTTRENRLRDVLSQGPMVRKTWRLARECAAPSLRDAFRTFVHPPPE